MTIDAHQHYWQPARGDYGWMPEDDPILSRPYSPENLADDLKSLGITHTVLVQAAPSSAETEYLLGIADATPRVAKVVGWINFEDESQIEVLRAFAAHPKFAGVRPMIQDIEDDDWMLRDDVQWAYQAIIDLDLTFDCLGFPQHLANFNVLLNQYPNMKTVIDHCMKPQFRNHTEASYQHWANGMTTLANNTNAYCKLSGLVTEADTDWSITTLKPYTDHLLSVFGADRIMWGSDWPVVRLRCEYNDWYQLAKELTSDLSSSQQERIFEGTAAHFYNID
jgi:L-fuconolactonase